MKFTKMHGCGNDYIYIDGAKEQVAPDEKPDFVRSLSDRHFGVGGDGVIFINPSDEADFEMEMYNADGTRAEMCGNGIRCVGKFVYDKGLTNKTDISVIDVSCVSIILCAVSVAFSIFALSSYTTTVMFLLSDKLIFLLIVMIINFCQFFDNFTAVCIQIFAELIQIRIKIPQL